MKKMISAILMMLLLVIECSSYAYADSWVQSEGKWYYEHNGAFVKDSWVCDDSKFYYLGSDGVMLHDTVTPDGRQVGPDGAWITWNSPYNTEKTSLLNFAQAEVGLTKHNYYKGLSAEQIAQADAVAQRVAAYVLSNKNLKSDLDKVDVAAWVIYYNYIMQEEYGVDENKYYRSPYGVFVSGNNTCAGGTRALGRVLDYLGYDWEHVNENQWSHQWCRLVMDGQVGYGDCMGFGCGYGTHPKEIQ